MKSSKQTLMHKWHNVEHFPGIWAKELLQKIFLQETFNTGNGGGSSEIIQWYRNHPGHFRSHWTSAYVARILWIWDRPFHCVGSASLILTASFIEFGMLYFAPSTPSVDILTKNYHSAKGLMDKSETETGKLAFFFFFLNTFPSLSCYSYLNTWKSLWTLQFCICNTC